MHKYFVYQYMIPYCVCHIKNILIRLTKSFKVACCRIYVYNFCFIFMTILLSSNSHKILTGIIYNKFTRLTFAQRDIEREGAEQHFMCCIRNWQNKNNHREIWTAVAVYNKQIKCATFIVHKILRIGNLKKQNENRNVNKQNGKMQTKTEQAGRSLDKITRHNSRNYC